METINDNNYERWLVRYADGNLAAAEREAVERWLDKHPDAAGELALYNEAPRLERNVDVRFDGTKTIARSVHVQPAGTTHPLWHWWRWAAAAAVALLLLVPVALHLCASGDEPVQVAAADISGTPVVCVPDTVAVVPAVPTASPVRFRNVKPVERNSTPQPAVEVTDSEPTTEPLYVAVEETVATVAMDVAPPPAEEYAVASAPGDTVEEPVAEWPLPVANEDTVTFWWQRLVTLNDEVHESLDAFYLGRRLARRLPDNDELLDRVDNARERSPRGLRMVTDLVAKLIEVNYSLNNQQNSKTVCHYE